jgi:hypothetical protein
MEQGTWRKEVPDLTTYNNLGSLSGGLQTSDCFPQLPKYRDFWNINISIKGILLH